MDLRRRLQRRTLLSAAIIFTLLLVGLAWWTLLDTRREIDATRSLVRATVQSVIRAQSQDLNLASTNPIAADGNTMRHVTIELVQQGPAQQAAAKNESEHASIERAGNGERSWLANWIGTETETIVLPSAGTERLLIVKPNARSELIEHLYFSVVAFSALLLLGLVVAVTQYRTLMHAFAPVQSLKAQLEKFEHGDLNARLEVPELEELAVIARTFNRLADSLQRLIGEQQRLSLSLISLRTDERHRLARELHDDLGQLLTAISVNIASLKRDGSDAAPNSLPIAALERDVQQLRDATRAMLAQLRDGSEQSLVPAQTPLALIHDWQQRFTGVHWQLDHDFSERFARLRLGEYEVAVRVLQEALTNVFKHSRPTEIRVELRFRAHTGQFATTIVQDPSPVTDFAECLVIENNGLGQLPGEPAPSLGLIGMNERAASIGALLRSGPMQSQDRWRVELRFKSEMSPT